MGETDPLISFEIQQQCRLVSTRVHLLEAQHRRYIGHTPSVNVEHRRQRRVDVVASQSLIFWLRGEGCCERERVQHELAMTEADGLGPTRRSRRVKGRADCILVELGEIETRARCREHGLVFAHIVMRRNLFAVPDQDAMTNIRQMWKDRIGHRQ
jgi:hypothetical protein